MTSAQNNEELGLLGGLPITTTHLSAPIGVDDGHSELIGAFIKL